MNPTPKRKSVRWNRTGGTIKLDQKLGAVIFTAEHRNISSLRCDTLKIFDETSQLRIMTDHAGGILIFIGILLIAIIGIPFVIVGVPLLIYGAIKFRICAF